MVRTKAMATKNTDQKPTAVLDGSRKKYKHKQSFLILKEIKRLQKGTDLLIPKAAFSRIVKEILQFSCRPSTDIRMSSESIKALHEALELYMVTYFEDCYLCTLHARRVTLTVKDMQLCRRLRGLGDVINK